LLHGLATRWPARRCYEDFPLLDSNWFWAIILLLSFVGLISEMWIKGGLNGRVKHVYRHVPEHMRQIGAVNLTDHRHIDWPASR
jgi:hypothetical protein